MMTWFHLCWMTASVGIWPFVISERAPITILSPETVWSFSRDFLWEANALKCDISLCAGLSVLVTTVTQAFVSDQCRQRPCWGVTSSGMDPRWVSVQGNNWWSVWLSLHLLFCQRLCSFSNAPWCETLINATAISGSNRFNWQTDLGRVCPLNIQGRRTQQINLSHPAFHS